jgi:predicted exporter
MAMNNRANGRALIGLWIVGLIICVVVIARAEFTADLSAFLPRRPTPTQQILIDQLNDGVASRSLIIAIEGAPTENLVKLSQILGQSLRETSLFTTVQNGQGQDTQADQALLFNYRFLLSPAVNPQRMSTEGLRAAIQDSLLEVASSTGLYSKALLQRDPTGESLEVIKRVIPDTSMATSNGVWVNQKQTRALLLVQTKALGSDLDGQEIAQAAITNAFTQAKASSALDAKLLFSGPGLFATQSRDTIRSEAARLSTLGTILVLGLLYLIYRSFAALLLGALPVVSGALAGIAGVALGFGSVHAMTLGFGVTLIGEAVDYAIYLFVQHKPQHDSFSAQFWPTIRLGVLTSVAGFVTLLFSGFTGLAQLGLFTIAGITVAALVTRFVLPQLMPSSFRIHRPVKLGQLLAQSVTTLQRAKWPMIGVVVMAAAFLATNVNRLWGTELSDLSPVPAKMQQLDEQLRNELGATEAGALIVIKAASQESALQLCEAVSTQLDQQISQQKLRSYEAACKFLPSQKTQLARQASLPDAASLQTRLEAALLGLPLKADKLSEFVTDVTSAKTQPLLTPANFSGTAMSLGLQALLSESGRKANLANGSPWTALISLRPVDGQALPIAALRADLPKSVHVLEIKSEADQMYRSYFDEAKTLTLAGLAAIIFLLVFFLRSTKRVLRVIVPLIAAVILVAAGIFSINGNLSLLHLIGLLLVVAVGSNYALFFDQKQTPDPTSVTDYHNMLSSLLFANLTTVVGFGLLAFSKVPVMSAIGVAVGPGALLALLLSAVFSQKNTA